jgi:hypothetical protein
LLEPGPDLRTLQARVRHKAENHTYTYRWANGAPLAEGEDAMKVNWFELRVTNTHGETVYHNAWVSDWKIDETNVASLAASARARWKIENENNNTLKTKSYHLEHNFGHDKKHMAAVLTSWNLLAFPVHTALGWLDEPLQVITRQAPLPPDVLRACPSPDPSHPLSRLERAIGLHDAGSRTRAVREKSLTGSSAPPRPQRSAALQLCPNLPSALFQGSPRRPRHVSITHAPSFALRPLFQNENC